MTRNPQLKWENYYRIQIRFQPTTLAGLKNILRTEVVFALSEPRHDVAQYN